MCPGWHSLPTSVDRIGGPALQDAALGTSRELLSRLHLLNANDGRRESVWWDGAQVLHEPGEPRSLNLALRATF